MSNHVHTIVMAVSNDLVTDQRVHRSCMALIESGFKVILIGRILPGSVPVERPYPTKRMKLLFRKKALFYAEFNIRLLLKMLFMRADAFYANDTDTLMACFVAARIRGKALFFDAHEMFPEMPELVGRPRIKHFWEKIEDCFLPRIARRNDMAAATVCQSIANIYKKRYGLSMAVVRNVPMMTESIPTDVSDILSKVPGNRKILLYQGAVNVGRGIEAVMEAMPLLQEFHLLVAGIGDKYDVLRKRAKELGCDNITFLGRLQPIRLHSLTRHADLGLTLLENRGLNYYYSFPNRIADFAQAGVPVLATDFPEIHHIIKKYGIGTLVKPAPFDMATQTSQWPQPHEMASIIRETLNYWNSLDKTDLQNRFAAASADLCWENDKKILLQAINTIFNKKSS